MGEPNAKVQPRINPTETQRQRWLKYGGNVVVTSVVVIALACGATWLGQKWNQPYDTTVGGEQSLRPQTVSFLQSIDKPIKITALYPKSKSDSKEQDFYTPVSDLLTDYASRNSNVTVEMVDPETNQEKLSELVSSVTAKYGGAVKPYQDLLASVDKSGGVLDQIAAYAKSETGSLIPLLRGLPQDTDQQTAIMVKMNDDGAAIAQAQSDSQQVHDDIHKDLASQVPGYNADVDKVNQLLSVTTNNLQVWQSDLTTIAGMPGLTKDLTAYIPLAEQRAKTIQAIVDKVVAQAKSLGELKELSDIKASLQTRSILVTSDLGYRIIPFDDIWHAPPPGGMTAGNQEQARKRFYGEPQVTAALAALSDQHPPMVVFMHAGGDPVAVGGDRGAMQYSALASRLREFNFDVQEKDINADATSDQANAGPSEEDLKRAIWVVIKVPSQNPMVPELGTLESKLNDHLEQDKGSALVLMMPNPKDPTEPKSTQLEMNDVLSSWGIHAMTNYCMAHTVESTAERSSGDQWDDAVRKLQPVFMLQDYGTHPIVRNLEGLDFFMYLACPIGKMDTVPSGVTVDSILPVPQSPHSWASGMTPAYMEGWPQEFRGLGYQADFTAKADHDSGHWYADVDNTADHPFYFGAAAEKAGYGRLVVVGNVDFPNTPFILETRSDNSGVTRLPGNGEFVTNAILWLAHRDDLLAISSRALEVPRVKPISGGTLFVVRLLLLTAGLPLMVIAAGLMVYWRRMD